MENTSGPTPQTPVRLLDELGPSEMGATMTSEHHRLVSMDEKVLEQGYDSDSNLGPFFDQVEEEDNSAMEAESPLDGENSDAAGAPLTTPTDEPTYCTFSDDEIKKLNVGEMRKYLEDKFGLKSFNMKQKELMEKMKEAVENKHPFVTTLGSNVVDNTVSGDIISNCDIISKMKEIVHKGIADILKQPCFAAVSQSTSVSLPSARTISTLTPNANREREVAGRLRKRRRNASTQTHDSTATSTTTSSATSTASASASSSLSSCTKASSRTKQARRIEDKAFVEGAPLNTTRLTMAFQHFPVPPTNNNACCQLHSWVAKDKKRRYKKNLAFCPECQVHLCMKCYSRFHKDHNILAQKESLTEEYKADNAKAVKDKKESTKI